MYDAWAAYDTEATTYLLGKTVGGFTCPFEGIAPTSNVQASRDTAISYAAYRLLRHRFANSPGNTNSNFFTSQQLDFKMLQLGFDISITSTDYQHDGAAALGNYIASQMIGFGFQDRSNEQFNYANLYYDPVNPPLVTQFSGNPNIVDVNRWQPLTLQLFIDQNGVPLPYNTPPALSPEWGNVPPFALNDDDLTVHERDNHVWRVYHDPGLPPQMVMGDAQASAEYMWNFALVSTWSSHLSPDDTEIWDISPASVGNLAVEDFPNNFDDYQAFYNLTSGGTNFSNGYSINPKTGQPYTPQYVTRGDYARVLAEFWADGPNSTTPPGHWFEILNYVMDQPDFVRKYRGEGEVLDALEYDVKAYFMLGGALHDAAITAWGIKGYYDGVRPISALRAMAELGQSSDPSLPSYNPNGLPLIPGFIEMVEAGDPLGGMSNEFVGEVKVLAWRGPDYIGNPSTDEAGVDWILAKNWWPYQRPTFVSPPFPGYISGHSTYSRTGAEVLTALTGDPFFPGGKSQFVCQQNQFLVFEDGPAQTITLEWATYRDASDQCSLSRIWGGIHPPADDIPGRRIGIELAAEAVAHAETFFFSDADGDGFYSNTDCDDNNPSVNPQATELCDGMDNNCNGQSDEGLAINIFYRDNDTDTYGDNAISESTCQAIPPTGFVPDNTDCNDNDAAINPGAQEVCDDLDNDCSGIVNDGLQVYTYYEDLDGDSFGSNAFSIDTCDNTAPLGFVNNLNDCDDTNAAINTNASEVCDNLDNDCDGTADDGLPVFTYYLDADGDGFGDGAASQTTCQTTPPPSYILVDGDCDDNAANANPNATEVNDGIDNDCDGQVDEVSATTDVAKRNWKLSPNPTTGNLNIQYEFSGKLNIQVFSADGSLQFTNTLDFAKGSSSIDFNELPQGVYLLEATDGQGNRHFAERVVKL